MCVCVCGRVRPISKLRALTQLSMRDGRLWQALATGTGLVVMEVVLCRVVHAHHHRFSDVDGRLRCSSSHGILHDLVHRMAQAQGGAMLQACSRQSCNPGPHGISLDRYY